MSMSLPQHSKKSQVGALALVVVAHALALYWATRQVVLPVTKPQTMAMQAVVIMPVALPTQITEPTKPVPVKQTPVIQPKTQPVLEPHPHLAPTEKSITLEKQVPVTKTEPVVEQKAPVTPIQEAPVVSKATEPAPEPEIIPPRSDASSLNNPQPVYPSMSRRLAEQGRVLLEVLILANGKVGDIKLKQSSGYKRLDDAAIQAVKQWQYQPAKRGSQAIDFWYVQPISFNLNT